MASEPRGRLTDGVLEAGVRHHLVDEPPLCSARALDALLRSAEHVGVIAADAGLRTEPGVNLTLARFSAFETHKIFASTEGALCEQLSRT